MTTKPRSRTTLELEPEWPAALAAFAWFLHSQAIQQEQHGSLAAAVADATQMLSLAGKLPTDERLSYNDARVLPAALQKMADVLVLRGHPGDAEQALAHCQRSLALRERLLQANPESAQAARDVLVSHFKLSELHRQRGDEQTAKASLAQCFAILDDFVTQGRPMDAEMRELHRELQQQFSQP